MSCQQVAIVSINWAAIKLFLPQKDGMCTY